jgi:cytochrome c biogenesis protein CcmG, thiol:disulfide interchange protein DsbE
MRKSLRGAAFAASVLLLSGLLPAVSRAAGQEAPALVVPTMNGDSFDLAALRGRVVLVHFWATWCSPCREEIPALNAFYRRYHDQGVELIGVSADKKRDAGEVRKMSADISFPVAMASAATKNGFGSQGSLPVTYVIDRSGIVRSVMRPKTMPVTEANLTATVLPLLSGP